MPRLDIRYLRDHRNRQNAERLRLGDAWHDQGLVFASSIGTPIEPRNVNRRWDELREKAGLDWLRLHDLRHGCATFLLAAGVKPRAIMGAAGPLGDRRNGERLCACAARAASGSGGRYR